MLRYIKSTIATLLVLGLLVGAVFQPIVNAAIPGESMVVNYNSSGTGLAGDGNMKAYMSTDGNIVIWGSSNTSNTVSGIPLATGTNIYVRNLKTGDTSIANIKQNGDPFGTLASGNEFAISSTGRFVAMVSSGTDIVSSPTVPSVSDRWQLYLRDTLLNTTTLVTQNVSGVAATYNTSGRVYVKSVSDDGRFVSFATNARNMLSSVPSTPGLHYFVKDMKTGQVINIMASSSGQSADASIVRAVSNCDGSIYLVTTAATNLSSDTSGNNNVYLVDIRNGYSIENITSNINEPVDGPAISCNGRYVVLATNATDLTSDSVSGTDRRLFRYDRFSGEYNLIDKSTSGYIPTTAISSTYSGGVSDNGHVVFFGRDPQLVTPTAANSLQVYLRDPDEGTTELVPVDSSGIEYGIGTTTFSTRNLQITSRGDYALYNTTSQTMIPGIGSLSGGKIVRSKLN